jgi:predicted dehydrogenase
VKLALCVIGCGDFAKTFARAMASLRDEIDLYFASRDLQRAKSYAQEFGGVGAFGSYSEAAADPRVSALYLCTPHHLHLEHTLLAARAGKHILVEKPIARSLSEAQEMVTQARQAGVTLMVAENYRFMSAARGAKDLIEDRAIGDLRLIQLQEEAYFQPREWRQDRELNGGGVLIDGGIHKADLLVYFSGMPEQVFAAALPPALQDAGGEDGAVVMTRSAAGVVGVINHSWVAAPAPVHHLVTVSGTAGQISFEVDQPSLKLIDRNGEQTLSYAPDQHGLAPMFREFRDSIKENREPLTSGATGIDALSVVLKAYESIETGRSVSLD